MDKEDDRGFLIPTPVNAKIETLLRKNPRKWYYATDIKNELRLTRGSMYRGLSQLYKYQIIECKMNKGDMLRYKKPKGLGSFWRINANRK